jgi:hypothetical protein
MLQKRQLTICQALTPLVMPDSAWFPAGFRWLSRYAIANYPRDHMQHVNLTDFEAESYVHHLRRKNENISHISQPANCGLISVSRLGRDLSGNASPDFDWN